MRAKDYLLRQVKTNKLGNEITVRDGIKFDSKKESLRYSDLLLAQKAGEIKDLELQPKFELLPSFTDFSGTKHRAITYIADFKYWDKKYNAYIVEDVKGIRTEAYNLKKKLFLSRYAYKFIET